jgi:hypothetical protein
MSKEIVKEGKEALERALLMMKYDMKKTLTENVEVVSEQTAMTDQEIEDRRIGNLISKASYGMGTDEDAIIDGFGQIKNVDQFNRINNNYKKYNQDYGGGTYTSLENLLQDELDRDDIDTINSIQKTLSKIGVTVTYEKSLDDNTNEIILISNTIKLIPKSVVKPPKSGETNIGTSCLSSLKSTGKNKAGCPTYDINGQKYAFCSNGRANGPDGMANWSCSGGKIIYNGKTISSRGSGSSTQYTPCPANGPYKQGCKSDVVKQIQGCLGVRTTGNFGPLTQTALSKIGYSNGFTSVDVEKICNEGTKYDLQITNVVTAEKGI